jgi:hypothetical protein
VSNRRFGPGTADIGGAGDRLSVTLAMCKPSFAREHTTRLRQR